ncbi:hypothetical protein NUW54_g6231 [Trametes sanguinea]|uniref:Uncharacterized protein n=1 Tax=Trametes sanguinea TaxID=158606 RepID=A0ACC1PTC4_9APHY|nr:hypothetical protein NUW54_g6231 [Trametes sanguinea]
MCERWVRQEDEVDTVGGNGGDVANTGRTVWGDLYVLLHRRAGTSPIDRPTAYVLTRIVACRTLSSAFALPHKTVGTHRQAASSRAQTWAHARTATHGKMTHDDHDGGHDDCRGTSGRTTTVPSRRPPRVVRGERRASGKMGRVEWGHMVRPSFTPASSFYRSPRVRDIRAGRVRLVRPRLVVHCRA